MRWNVEPRHLERLLSWLGGTKGLTSPIYRRKPLQSPQGVFRYISLWHNEVTDAERNVKCKSPKASQRHKSHVREICLFTSAKDEEECVIEKAGTGVYTPEEGLATVSETATRSIRPLLLLAYMYVGSLESSREEGFRIPTLNDTYNVSRNSFHIGSLEQVTRGVSFLYIFVWRKTSYAYKYY